LWPEIASMETAGVRAHVFTLNFPAKKADRRVRIRVFMFERFRHFLPAAAWLFWAATAWADRGYLPVAGPLPLRFRVLPPPVSDQASAPAAPAPPAPISPPLPPMPSVPKETAPVPPIQPVTNGPTLEYNAREPVTGSAPVMAPDGLISPQMLIKYFTTPAKAATHATSAEAMAPVGFTPPMVATPGPTPPPANKGTNATAP
jgi:hypothetical protein